jgi:hypothetical protein
VSIIIHRGLPPHSITQHYYVKHRHIITFTLPGSEYIIFFCANVIPDYTWLNNCYRYFEDFEKKIPRHEIEQIEEIIKKEIHELDPEYLITICGSYRYVIQIVSFTIVWSQFLWQLQTCNIDVSYTIVAAWSVAVTNMSHCLSVSLLLGHTLWQWQACNTDCQFYHHSHLIVPL